MLNILKGFCMYPLIIIIIMHKAVVIIIIVYKWSKYINDQIKKKHLFFISINFRILTIE